MPTFIVISFQSIWGFSFVSHGIPNTILSEIPLLSWNPMNILRWNLPCTRNGMFAVSSGILESLFLFVKPFDLAEYNSFNLESLPLTAFFIDIINICSTVNYLLSLNLHFSFQLPFVACWYLSDCHYSFLSSFISSVSFSILSLRYSFSTVLFLWIDAPDSLRCHNLLLKLVPHRKGVVGLSCNGNLCSHTGNFFLFHRRLFGSSATPCFEFSLFHVRYTIHPCP